MFELWVNNAFSGHFSSLLEAVHAAQSQAVPFNLNWKVIDPFGKVAAQG